MSRYVVFSTDMPSRPMLLLTARCLFATGVASLLLLLSLYSGIVQGAQTTLAWDPNTDPAVAGYRLYWGTQSGQYALLEDVGNSTSVVLQDLQDGTTYYFVATAYDNQGNESAYSNEVSFSTPGPCNYSLSPTSQTFGNSAATGLITVTTQAGCAWTASGGGTWMTITSDASGTGSGTITYAVASNTGAVARMVAATVAGLVFTVTQAGSENSTVPTSSELANETEQDHAEPSESTLEPDATSTQTTETSSPGIISEYSDYFDTVQKMYMGYYQRAADPEGLVYWAGRLAASGGNLTGIIEEFANSAESRALYGTIDGSNIAIVINDIYNVLFGRDAEAEGLNYYVSGFESGRCTATTIMLDILFGAQNEDQQSINGRLAEANLITGITGL